MTDLTQHLGSHTTLYPGALWTPIAGAEWKRLAAKLAAAGSISATELDELKSSSLEILARSTPPTAGTRERTGLVLGQVQSGKTLSFTAVSSLARDNGFRMVIVITGTSVQLLDQSVARLQSDLDLNSTSNRCWVHLPIESEAATDPSALLRYLSAWDDPNTLPHLRKTVLITVMKQHHNLNSLRNLLVRVSQQFAGGLTAMPTLIIDDEADQASLNTRVRMNEISTVYARIRALRRALPNHTMLQYTATPQAPLLLNIADLLSPDFCKVLTPGRDYTGGRSFFLENRELVRTIPADEIGTQRNPSSLREALRLFLLGVADSIQDPNAETRSMLVHPSVETSGHQIFHDWITITLRTWNRVLRLAPDNPDRRALLEEFRASHEDLARTATGIRPFEFLSTQLCAAIGATQPQIVNRVGGAATIVQWANSPAWILIGGMAMDRGFTVRGLTVTYMPRPLAGNGQGNADTLQQRARFFGYKRGYLGFCRVFLESNVQDALQAYVQHEDELRNSLKSFESLARPLSDWRRRFILDPAMQPTRRNVVDIDWVRNTQGSDPVLLFAPHHDPAHVARNRDLVAELRQKPGWRTLVGEPNWTEFQKHSVLTMSLRELCDAFLLRFQTNSLEDSESLNRRLLQLTDIVEANPAATVDVFLMSEGASTPRTRTADPQSNLLPNFLQGANPSVGNTGARPYPGDRKLGDQSTPMVQIHMLDITNDEQVLIGAVPTLAIFAPAAAPISVVRQPQGTV